MSIYRVLSVKQPWAYLIVHGIKDIENRTWKTSHRGPLLIHASAKPDSNKEIRAIELAHGIELPADLPCGGVVGAVNGVDCVTSSHSQWFFGPVGWSLTDARVLPFAPARVRLASGRSRLTLRKCQRSRLNKASPELTALGSLVDFWYYFSAATAGDIFMRVLLACFLCFSTVCLASSNDGAYKLKYDGGSIPNVKTGAGMKLYLDQNRIRIVADKGDVLLLAPSAVTEISYGQDVHRRVGTAIGLAVISLGVGALMALSKSKKHFIGLTWDVSGAKGGAAFQADKNEYRGVLAGLEGITGKKAINSDAMNVKN